MPMTQAGVFRRRGLEEQVELGGAETLLPGAASPRLLALVFRDPTSFPNSRCQPVRLSVRWSKGGTDETGPAPGPALARTPGLEDDLEIESREPLVRGPWCKSVSHRERSGDARRQGAVREDVGPDVRSGNNATEKHDLDLRCMGARMHGRFRRRLP